ncbi:hypothetical protein OIN80_17515, partial [Acinetobacter baumannii]|nr:hypothetical protein [Acinetobacter baumannii]
RELLKQNAELSASDIFEQKVIKECSNTYESPCDLPPIYNMRETIGDICLMYPDIEVIATQTCVGSTNTQVE